MSWEAEYTHGSRYPHMRELRIRHGGRPIRVLYGFDPRRVALLPIGGDKTGDHRWYERFIPLADGLYQEHLERLQGSTGEAESQDG